MTLTKRTQLEAVTFPLEPQPHLFSLLFFWGGGLVILPRASSDLDPPTCTQ
jgi:hypothetical protein